MPGAAVLAHLEKLLADGANLAGISMVSGVPVSTLDKIRRRDWVQGATASALLGVTEAPALPPAGMTSALGACRRVRALVALGWSLTEQARRLGVHLQRVQLLSSGRQNLITEATAHAVDALFEQLCAVPGGSVRARNDARRKGWLPPLAWDDIDNPHDEPCRVGDSDDGPDEHVDEVAVERVLAGERIDLTDVELVAVLRAGVARGEHLSRLADRLGINYWGARRMLGGELTPRREKQARIEAEILRSTAGDYVIAAQLGVQRSTVSRARARLAKAGRLEAAS